MTRHKHTISETPWKHYRLKTAADCILFIYAYLWLIIYLISTSISKNKAKRKPISITGCNLSKKDKRKMWCTIMQRNASEVNIFFIGKPFLQFIPSCLCIFFQILLIQSDHFWFNPKKIISIQPSPTKSDLIQTYLIQN